MYDHQFALSHFLESLFFVQLHFQILISASKSSIPHNIVKCKLFLNKAHRDSGTVIEIYMPQ